MSHLCQAFLKLTTSENGFFDGDLTPTKLANADHEELYKAINFVHYNKQKAKHLIECAALLKSEFGGLVPLSQSRLQRFPGIGPTMADLLSVILPEE